MDVPPLAIQTMLLVRELATGDRVVAPVTALSLVSFGSMEHCLSEQRLFLGEHLARIAPEAVAGFGLPPGLRLETVDVLIPRDGLPRRLQIKTPIAMPSVIIPTPEGDAWVLIVAMNHVFHVPRGEVIVEAIRAEARRLSGAREMDPWEYLRLLPARRTELLPMEVQVTRPERLPSGRAAHLRKALVDREKTARATEVLASIGTPLHLHSPRRGGPVVGRTTEVHDLASVLNGRSRIAVVVLGEALAGKTAVVRQWLRERLTYDPRARVYATSGAQLIAGMSGLGQWEARVRRVMEAAETLDAVLYFDNLGDLLTDHADPSRGGVDLPGALRPWLEEGRVRIVAELRADQLDSAERRQPALLACFHRVRVGTMDARATADALRATVAWERAHDDGRPRLNDAAIHALVELAERYLPYESFPGKAYRLYDDLRALNEHDPTAPPRPREITPDDVHEGFSARSGVPAFLLRDDRSVQVERIVADLQRRVVGQDAAVRRVAEIICVVKARLQPTGRPLAVLLFVGPTGVGKTELARATAALLFGSGDRMVRFDMSEFTDAEAADRLIRGTDRAEGLLTRKVREQPFCVLLLDEVEKAHPAVFDLLLQVTGEGRLTDGRGQTAFFHNAIIVLTSNLGAATKREAAGFTPSGDTSETYFQREVDRTFRPEFVNRLDRIVVFHPLTSEHLRAVAGIAIDRIRARRGLTEAGTSLVVSANALDALVARGYSARYGGRALRRHLEDHLVAPMARMLSALGAAQSPVAVHVTLSTDDPPPTPQGTISVSVTVRDGLRMELFRARANTTSRELRGLDALANLRRRVDITLERFRPVELRERIDFLVTSLDHGKSGSDPITAREMASLRSEHHRLSTVWERLVATQSDVHTVEELALIAALERSSADDLVAETVAIRRRFDYALAYALVAMEPRRDAITLLISELDEHRALDRWLIPLFEAARDRGWAVQVHLRGGPRSEAHRVPTDSVTTEWPADREWGPPRLQLRDLDELTRDDRDRKDVLVRVSGEWSGALLAPEAGLHVWDSHGTPETTRLFIRRLGMSTVISDRRWTRHAALVPPLGNALDDLRRQPFTRIVDTVTGLVRVPSGLATNLGDSRYFQHLEEIVALHLLRYEDDGAPERADVFVGPLDFPDTEGDG